MTLETMTPLPLMPSLASPKTAFADFKGQGTGRQFIERLKQEMRIGVYSINAPTGTGGCRVAVQIESAAQARVLEIISEMEGSAGPTVDRAKTAIVAATSKIDSRAERERKKQEKEEEQAKRAYERAAKQGKQAGGSAQVPFVNAAGATAGPCPLCGKNKRADLPGHIQRCAKQRGITIGESSDDSST